MELYLLLVIFVLYNRNELFGKIAKTDGEFNYKFNKLLLLKRYGNIKGRIDI